MQLATSVLQPELPLPLGVKSESIPDSELFLPLDGVESLGAVVTLEGASIEAHFLAAMGKALGTLTHSPLDNPPKADGRHGHPYKATLEVRAFIFETKRDNAFLAAREIVWLVHIKFTIELSISHVNYLLRQEGLSSKVGRRKKTKTPSNLPVPTVEAMECQHAGLFFLKMVLLLTGISEELVKTVQHCIEGYLQSGPPDRFALLHHRDTTLLSRLETLLFLPLLPSVARLRDLQDYQGEGLGALVDNGVSYAYSTLEQFLGQLERVGVSEALMAALARKYLDLFYGPEVAEIFIYVDGYLKASWTRQYAPCGKVADRGRVMPATKYFLVNAPQGQPLYAQPNAGDTHWKERAIELEEWLEEATGRKILFSIFDREGNSLKLAHRYQQAPRGFLTLLARSQYRSLQDFEFCSAPQLYAWGHYWVVDAGWSDPQKQEADGRRFVLLVPLWMKEGNDFVVFSTNVSSQRLPALEVPEAYRGRWSHQEAIIREMKAPLKLAGNYGNKTVEVEDRVALKKREKLLQKVEVVERRLQNNAKKIEYHQERKEKYDRAYGEKMAVLNQKLEEIARDNSAQEDKRGNKIIEMIKDATGKYQAKQSKIDTKYLAPLEQKREDILEEKQKLQQEASQVDTNKKMHERILEKDSIMMCLKLLMLNLGVSKKAPNHPKFLSRFLALVKSS